jgi:DNA processing protein
LYAELLEAGADARTLLETALGGGEAQAELFPAADAAELVATASDAIERWQTAGLQIVTVLDPDYPANLRAVHDRPLLVFVAGRLASEDARSVAIIGSRRPSPEGQAEASGLATELSEGGYTIVSGLATGIDSAAHTATLAAEGRTVAVIGTGLEHSYPPENAALQRQIAARGAVISQFWPEAPPRRESFPKRNAVMSGLAAGTAIVDASVRSGARIQARQALAHGRPVFLARRLLAQSWAQELAARPGVTVYDHAEDIAARLERLSDGQALTA